MLGLLVHAFAVRQLLDAESSVLPVVRVPGSWSGEEQHGSLAQTQEIVT